jgi:sulfur-carrier protein adenylyltransferase/sulfurtransferase
VFIRVHLWFIMPLSPDEIARYQRHLSLAGFGIGAQEKLKSSSVLVIGAGGLGCPALLYLAAAGIGRIEMVDDDRVEVSNLQRQVLYTEADAGELKVEAAARRLSALNRLIQVVAHPARFSRENALELVRGVDVVVDGSDNFATRYLVNDACVLANRPLVYGAIQGFEGQASVFNWREGPTYRCLFPEPPEPGTVPNCADAGVLGVLPGLIGTVQALEALKLLSGIGEPLSGKLLLWDALTMTTRTVRVAPDPRSRQITDLPPDGYGETCAVKPKAVTEVSVTQLLSDEWSRTGAVLPEEIDVSDLTAAQHAGAKPQVLDVRESWERMLGAIEPSAHIALGEIESGRADLTHLDAGRPTVVYCAAGMRSLRAAELMRMRYGFRNVASLRGGIKAWAKQR